ncbi:hypothetical protein N307_12057, partial [Dryobates pubescens]
QEKQLLDAQEMPLASRETETLCHEEPETGNPYLEDALLRSYLKAHLPPQVLEEVNRDLERFGHRLLTQVKPLGWECELSPPVLRQYAVWLYCVPPCLTQDAFDPPACLSLSPSRLYQAVKLYLFSSFSGGFNCPLAMTDGAAKVIESLGMPGPLKTAFGHLTSRDPERFWTSGQWMTERRGGSDVAGGTETVARKQPDGTYLLHGFKWFTSAADSDVALTLARIADAEGQVKQVCGVVQPGGTAGVGLSLFFLRVRDEAGKLNNIQVQRLKDKLGTRQMATAELWLQGAKAELISAEGRGVSAIAGMLNVTRIHNVIGAVASMRRMLSLSREYARRRVAFGRLLKDHPLHMQTLARMEVQTRGACLLLLEIARLLGLAETKLASEQDQLLLRLLVPVAKLYTGKQASAVALEAMESFGGQGYMEDTGLPALVRDSLVLSIWEGTTNVLALDVLRSLSKSRGQGLAAFLSTVQKKTEKASSSPELEAAVQQTREAAGSLSRFTQAAASRGALTMELAARDFSYSLARIYSGALLIEHAARPGASPADISAAQRWCQQELCPVATGLESSSYEAREALLDTALVYEGSPAHGSRL